MEAKRRAIVMAYLTYDMTRHSFVKLNTSSMLENPFNLNSIYEIHELHGLDVLLPEVNIQQLIVKQDAQPHSGFILTNKDVAQVEEYLKTI